MRAVSRRTISVAKLEGKLEDFSVDAEGSGGAFATTDPNGATAAVAAGESMEGFEAVSGVAVLGGSPSDGSAVDAYVPRSILFAVFEPTDTACPGARERSGFT